MTITPEQEIPMSSTRPYLVRAFYEWILDNDCTPYLLVNSELPHVIVPKQHIDKDGTIVLNIAPMAVQKLLINNESVRFGARFDGNVWDICIPMYAILAIYAHENGQGMVFEEDELLVIPENTPLAPSEKKPAARPSHLTVVK